MISLKEFNTLLQSVKIIDGSYPLKALVWLPYGYKILKLTEEYLCELFEKYGYERYSFPFLAPVKEFEKIDNNISSFEAFIYRVSESAILRPSGESVIYPMFRRWVNSFRDLPIRAYQIGAAFRRGSVRGFMRPNEIDFFVEAHAAFSSSGEAILEIHKVNKLVEEFMIWLGVPTLKTIRPSWTNKPVARKEFAFDALLPTGETILLDVNYLQMQIFSKIFNIKFLNNNGVNDYTYQTEFGFSQRAILTAIWLSSNNKSIFLLPQYAPIQVVVMAVGQLDDDLIRYIGLITETLKISKTRFIKDEENGRFSRRISKYKAQGIPVRMEIGRAELVGKNVKIVRHDNKVVTVCDYKDLVDVLKNIFKNISHEAYQNKMISFKDNIVFSGESDNVRELIGDGNIVKLDVCFKESCVRGLENKVGIGEVIGFDYENKIECKTKKCIYCGCTCSDSAYYSRRV